MKKRIAIATILTGLCAFSLNVKAAYTTASLVKDPSPVEVITPVQTCGDTGETDSAGSPRVIVYSPSNQVQHYTLPAAHCDTSDIDYWSFTLPATTPVDITWTDAGWDPYCEDSANPCTAQRLFSVDGEAFHIDGRRYNLSAGTHLVQFKLLRPILCSEQDNICDNPAYAADFWFQTPASTRR